MLPQRLKILSLLLALCFLCLSYTAISAHSEPVQWEVNGHWYDAIGFDESITWIKAFFHARRQTYQDLPGHLATLTSQEENDFVWQTFEAYDYHLGGFQVRRARKVDRGWRWITGERFIFTNWGSGEPNDCCETTGIEDGEENCLHFWTEEPGVWNDIGSRYVQDMYGYIIEYEEMPEQALLAPIKLKDIHQLTTTWAKLKQVR